MDFIESLNFVEDWILGVADAWWVHLVVYLLAALDGFFPSAPSESVIVTLTSLWSTSGQPALIPLFVAAWLGAFTGDNTGYLIGRTIGWERFKFLREGKGRRAVEAAERGLNKRALLLLMTARYIPLGRTAVNLVAGAVKYPHRSFWPRSLLSTFVWAVYSCGIGVVAGSWFTNNPLLGITVALLAAGVIAVIVERLVTLLHRVLDRRTARREAEAAEGGQHGDPETPDTAAAPVAATDVAAAPTATDAAAAPAATDAAAAPAAPDASVWPGASKTQTSTGTATPKHDRAKASERPARAAAIEDEPAS